MTLLSIRLQLEGNFQKTLFQIGVGCLKHNESNISVYGDRFFYAQRHIMTDDGKTRESRLKADLVLASCAAYKRTHRQYTQVYSPHSQTEKQIRVGLRRCACSTSRSTAVAGLDIMKRLTNCRSPKWLMCDASLHYHEPRPTTKKQCGQYGGYALRGKCPRGMMIFTKR